MSEDVANTEMDEAPNGEPARCSSDGSTACFDDIPPRTRDAISIAADLVREVDCKHRPLACEAARKLKQIAAAETERQLAEAMIGDATVPVGKRLHAKMREDIEHLITVCERAALALCHAGVPDDGTHALSDTMIALRVVRTERFQYYED